MPSLIILAPVLSTPSELTLTRDRLIYYPASSADSKLREPGSVWSFFKLPAHDGTYILEHITADSPAGMLRGSYRDFSSEARTRSLIEGNQKGLLCVPGDRHASRWAGAGGAGGCRGTSAPNPSAGRGGRSRGSRGPWRGCRPRPPCSPDSLPGGSAAPQSLKTHSKQHPRLPTSSQFHLPHVTVSSYISHRQFRVHVHAEERDSKFTGNHQSGKCVAQGRLQKTHRLLRTKVQTAHLRGGNSQGRPPCAPYVLGPHVKSGPRGFSSLSLR